MMFFHLNEIAAAKHLVESYHYSGRWPGGVLVATWHEAGGLFGDSGDAVAACVFGSGNARWSEPVLELTRLVRHPDKVCDPLSGLISASVRWVRRQRLADVVVSYADATHDHHGGVYQAASWNYDGQRDERMDGLVIDGTFVPGRTCNARYGTQSPNKLQTLLPQASIEPSYDLGKHLYWKAVTRRGVHQAARMGLRSVEYVKPR